MTSGVPPQTTTVSRPGIGRLSRTRTRTRTRRLTLGVLAAGATLIALGWTVGAALCCRDKVAELRERNQAAWATERLALEEAAQDRIKKARLDWERDTWIQPASQTSEIVCAINGSRCQGEYAETLPRPALLEFSYVRDPATCTEAEFRIYLGPRQARRLRVGCPATDNGSNEYLLLSPSDPLSTEVSYFRIVLESMVTPGFPFMRLKLGTPGWVAYVSITKYDPRTDFGAPRTR